MSQVTRGAWWFLGLTFGGGWGYLFVVASLADASLTNPLAQLPIALTPALAALVVRRWITGEGFGDAALRPRLRRAWRYYLLAWLGPWAMLVGAFGLATLLGAWHWGRSAALVEDPGLVGMLVLVVAVPLLTPLYWGEEFGWTGYLCPRLLTARPLVGVLATGLLWGVWHYPLAFVGYVHYHALVAGLLLWTVAFVCQEVVFVWLRQRAGTIWAASVAHAGYNLVYSFLVELVLLERGGGSEITVALIALAPLAVAAAGVVLTGTFNRPSIGGPTRPPTVATLTRG